jgi:hypothetical protein
MTIDKHVITYILPLIEYNEGKKLINNNINIITVNKLIKTLHKICFEDKNPQVTGFIFESNSLGGVKQIIAVII